jgi:tRNA uridine 5-carboxymethylaminomethyl modification enzyme
MSIYLTTDQPFDTIVIGAGHAGVEAALATARMECRTLLITHDIETIGQMSCNPAIGGVGKSHLVREIDALGGAMAQAADRAGIHFRLLNESKGPAVQAIRAQIDRALYKQVMREIIQLQPNLCIFQDSVGHLLLDGDKTTGVMTRAGLRLKAKTVILAAGTFLNGVIHIGKRHYSGGRTGGAASITLANHLRQLSFRTERLKTGTPPRIDRRSIDFSVLETQSSDEKLPSLSFLGMRRERPTQVSCFMTRTQVATHDIIVDNLESSAIYSGNITGTGPRYCPSIEDKVKRFSNRLSHQIFLEPEGLHSYEVYPNGISTSLPFDVQKSFVRSIPGLENAHITRPGYAIEYDFFDPRDLYPSLETRKIENLFFAGQINGTTGYEEAAAQGLLAGINAARKVQGKPMWTLERHEAYIGVMIDDLITCGTKEPYRMFTSRAEHRLLLRQDNADERLTPKGHQLGCVSKERWRVFEQKQHDIKNSLEYVKQTKIKANAKQSKAFQEQFSQRLANGVSVFELLQRPQLSYMALKKLFDLKSITSNVIDAIEIQARYAGYIERQQQEIDRVKRDAHVSIPETFNFDAIPSLSNEVKQKLKAVKPLSIAQASRISGMTPAALSILRIYLKRKGS